MVGEVAMSALRAVPDLSGLDREATVAALRKSMAGLGAAVPESAGDVDEGYGPGGGIGDGDGEMLSTRLRPRAWGGLSARVGCGALAWRTTSKVGPPPQVMLIAELGIPCR